MLLNNHQIMKMVHFVLNQQQLMKILNFVTDESSDPTENNKYARNLYL